MVDFRRDDAERFYDRFGARQDGQAFYEDAALDLLIERSHFDVASRIFELGCGTGRLARRLLTEVLPGDAQYLGMEISDTMLSLARGRLAAWPLRAHVERLPGGETSMPVSDGWADRFLSTYVFDLLDEAAIAANLTEARRVLCLGGLFCHAGITPGGSRLPRTLSTLWTGLWRLRPSLVGGCRPIVLERWLDHAVWETRFAGRVTRYGITSEVLVAAAR